MRILIVDDERPGRERLQRLLQDIAPEAELAEAADSESALRDIQRQPTDIVLLDIRLPGMDGLELAEHLCQRQPPPAIIFTTAFEQHALRAFNAHAIAYLLKPIAADKLKNALRQTTRLNRAQLDRVRRDTGASRSHVSGQCGDTTLIVPIGDIRYLRACRKYVEAVWPGGALLVNESLATLEKELAGRFLRVHRNALIALAHIRSLEKTPTGWHVRLADMPDPVTVSRRHAGSLRRQLNSL